MSTPIGTDAEQAADEWRRFGIRPLLSMSARVHVEHAPPPILEIVDERAAELDRPVPRSHDRRRRARGPALARRTREGGHAADHRRRTRLPGGAHARTARTGHVPDGRHRVADVDQRPHEPLPPRRDARGPRRSRCASSRSTSCERPCRRAASTRRARSCGSTSCSPTLTGDHEAFGEWPYFMSIFGAPGADEPWGWQIDGHHLCVNTVVFDDRIVMTPTFMGAEPRRVQPRPVRRHLAVRPGGGARPRPDPLVRPRAARPGDHPSVDPPRRHPGAPPEPVRRADAGGRVPRQPRRPLPGRRRWRHDRRPATPPPGARRHLRRLGAATATPR